MPEESKKAARSAKERVITSDPKEVRRWCLKFNVSPSELKKAVAEVGDDADKVERYFTTRRFSRSMR